MKSVKNLILKIIPILSFAIPTSILYFSEPESFEKTWGGRIFQTFFIWLILLETILDWDRLQVSFMFKKSFKRACLFLLFASIPTIYIVIFNFCGFGGTIVRIVNKQGVEEYIAKGLLIPIEYLFFTIFFCLIILTAYGIENLPVFSGSIFFLGIMGILFTIDNLYPGGKFVPLQMLVPITAFFSASLLELSGYTTAISEFNSPTFGRVSRLSVDSHALDIGWLCAGVESLIIYTIVIFIFLKKSEVTTKRKLLYFITGAVITYFINIMRIYTLALITLSGNVKAFNEFHNFYGQFYSITWITIYPIIIIGIENLLTKRARTET